MKRTCLLCFQCKRGIDRLPRCLCASVGHGEVFTHALGSPGGLIHDVHTTQCPAFFVFLVGADAPGSSVRREKHHLAYPTDTQQEVTVLCCDFVTLQGTGHHFCFPHELALVCLLLQGTEECLLTLQELVVAVCWTCAFWRHGALFNVFVQSSHPREFIQ